MTPAPYNAQASQGVAQTALAQVNAIEKEKKEARI
jgi:hypothetical protein